MSGTKILVIDDDQAMLKLTKFHLEERGYEVTIAETGAQGVGCFEGADFALALTDYQLPDGDGISVVERIKAIAPDTEVIMITGYSSVATAVEAIKAGAYYFVEKPIDYDELLMLVEKALERRAQASEIKHLRSKLTSRTSYHDLIGASKAMQDLYEIIENVAQSDANILIIGESGTGKELVANAIHYNSLRAKQPFMKVNCAALPKELIEAELFGHTKGAFTGASADKMGLIGRAAGGSLLLDEIGEMPLELQPKLLRVLQERVYYRLGSEKAYEADFRLISATNREPQEAIRNGQLREDLYYRINTIEIQVPPLRERPEDIQHLAEHFLRRYAEKYSRPVSAISQRAYELMFGYSWPGNVRELQNVMERMVLLSKGDAIGDADLPFGKTPSAVVSASPAPSVVKTAASVETAAAPTNPLPEQKDMSLEELCKLIVEKLPEPQPGSSLPDLFKQLEGLLAVAAMERTRGNKQAAANLLGIYRPRLYSMLKKYNERTEEAETPQAIP